MKYRALQIVVTGALFLFALVQVPDIHRDAQYYLQSAILWPRGQVTFAGTWIGSRSIVVLIYHLGFAAMGESIDAVAAVLALIKLCTAAALSVVSAVLIQSASVSAVIGIVLAVSVFSMPLMNIPATDNVAAMAIAITWAVWVVGDKLNIGFIRYGLFPLAAGLCYAVRAETIIFPVLLALASQLSSRQLPTIRATVVSAVVLAIGVFTPVLLWNAWIPVTKPAAYTGAIAVYLPLVKYGSDLNGPSSAKLYEAAEQTKGLPINYWEVVGRTFVKLGSEESNRLITQSGLEAISTNLESIAKDTASNVFGLLTFDSNASIRLSSGAEMRSLSKQLSDLDRARILASPNFGNDATYPTETLTEHPIGLISTLKRYVPGVIMSFQPPTALLLMSLITCFAATYFTRQLTWLSIPSFGIFILLLSAFSQGIIFRYMEPAILLNFAAVLVSLAVLLSRSPKQESGLRSTFHIRSNLDT